MILAIVLGLLAGGILMELTGNSAIEGYIALFKGATMSVARLGDSLATATILVFTGLSVAVAFKAGLFNIGATGQMMIGGLAATAVGLSIDLPKFILLPLMLLAAAISGAIWGGMAGWLKSRYNLHEVVSTIMLNWIAYWLVYYTVPAYFKGSIDIESKYLPLRASLRIEMLSKLFDDSYINLGLLLAVLAVFICAFLLNKTVFGFDLKAVGFSPAAARYAGIDVRSTLVSAMLLSGALAGIGGMCLYCGYMSSIQIDIMPHQGMDSIAVALLGSNSPWGVVFVAVFFGILDSGRGFMSAVTDIPAEISDVIIATIIYFAATGALLGKLLDKFGKHKTAQGGTADVDVN